MNRTRTVWLTIGGLIAASFLIRLWLYHYGWAVGRGNYVLFYFNTASHMDALMIGAAVAFAEVRWQGWAKKLLSGWSGALVLAAVLAGYATIANSSWPIEMGRRSSVTLMSVISGGCGLVLLLSLYWQPMRSLLSNSVLRHIGKLTYAMYVFHFWLADACSGWIRRTLVSSELVFWVLHVILTFVLTYAVAQVSWTLLESRMLTLRRRFRRQLTSAPLQERTKELVPV
jgi:peptidoglycan/LPS O-acetylase OafA/YrhL